MKRLVLLTLVLAILTTPFFGALATEILSKDGEHVAREIPSEPIVTDDPRAQGVPEEGGRSRYVQNTELKDTGLIELHWSGKARSQYGCSTAQISYTNPTRSNIGMVLSVAIFDGNLIKYFGTTYRSDEETLKLAMDGYDALKNGIYLSDAALLVEEGGLLEGMDAEEISAMSKEELVRLLAEKGFMDMTEEELMNLTEVGVEELNEIDRLTLAQLRGYGFYTFYQKIGETGVINPGYAIYEVDLYTLPGRVTIPKGEYDIVYVLNGYDKNWNRMSDFFVHLLVVLNVDEDLPEELQEEYGVTLATRID